MQERLAQLASMPGRELRLEWRREFRAEPPNDLTRDLLMRALAHRLQERARGSLSQTLKRTLRSLAGQISKEGANGALKLAPALTPGVRLVRDWGGQAHSVLVLEDGFEYRGGRYRSLTEVARRITGAHWSGPRFFGVRQGENAGSGKPGRRRRNREQVGQDDQA